MLGLFTLALIVIFVLWYQPTVEDSSKALPQKISVKLDKLWGIAQESLRDQKYLRAEKALLTILRVDERNATAYNRLGILYAKQQAYKDAIECFEIAQSLEPSASSLHNVGLIYYETGDYEKAAQAFSQALSMEDTLAARHIAYAKVLEKQGHKKEMIESLEKAVEIEPSPQALNILADAYERNEMADQAELIRERVEKMLKSRQAPQKRVKQVRRVL